MGVSWIEYKSTRILFVDYRGAKTPEEMIKILDEQERYEIKDPRLRILTNFEGTYGNNAYMDKVKAYGKRLRGNSSVRQAVLGITGIKKILFEGYILFTGDKSTKTFATEDEAKEWLIK
jgi:hypothetical protein